MFDLIARLVVATDEQLHTFARGLTDAECRHVAALCAVAGADAEADFFAEAVSR